MELSVIIGVAFLVGSLDQKGKNLINVWKIEKPEKSSIFNVFALVYLHLILLTKLHRQNKFVTAVLLLKTVFVRFCVFYHVFQIQDAPVQTFITFAERLLISQSINNRCL